MKIHKEVITVPVSYEIVYSEGHRDEAIKLLEPHQERSSYWELGWASVKCLGVDKL